MTEEQREKLYVHIGCTEDNRVTKSVTEYKNRIRVTKGKMERSVGVIAGSSS
jgi:hypothetical protein